MTSSRGRRRRIHPVAGAWHDSPLILLLGILLTILGLVGFVFVNPAFVWLIAILSLVGLFLDAFYLAELFRRG